MKQADDSYSGRRSSLDISPEAIDELARQAVTLVKDYFEGVARLPVFPETKGGDTARRLGADLPLEGAAIERLIEDCRAIIQNSRHNGHPRFFGYVASPATPAGAFADLIASTANISLTSWRSAPGATEVERLVVRWLGLLIGYGNEADGLLTSGGSMANLIALLVAHRAKADGDPARQGLWNSNRMTIYASDQIHMSIPKGMDILGLGRDQVRVIESDGRFRLKPADLAARLRQDLNEGLKPFSIVASAGTVNTGAVDPLDEIAEIASEHGLWFHVDGAYGALGRMDQRKRELFKGLERADSVSLDPHKWLYTPVDCGCLLLRDKSKARAAFSANEADYIKVHGLADSEAFAFWDYGIELSRRFRALKIYLTLRFYGSRRIAEAISDDNSLAQYLAQRIQEAKDFELLAPIELSICCFRYVPAELGRAVASGSESDRRRANAALDELNARIMHRVQRGGKAYLSNATLQGKFALRVCITNFRTTRSDIDATLEVVREAAVES